MRILVECKDTLGRTKIFLLSTTIKSNIIDVCCMLGYALLQERRKDLINRPKKSSEDLYSMFSIRKPKRVTRF